MKVAVPAAGLMLFIHRGLTEVQEGSVSSVETAAAHKHEQ